MSDSETPQNKPTGEQAPSATPAPGDEQQAAPEAPAPEPPASQAPRTGTPASEAGVQDSSAGIAAAAASAGASLKLDAQPPAAEPSPPEQPAQQPAEQPTAQQHSGQPAGQPPAPEAGQPAARPDAISDAISDADAEPPTGAPQQHRGEIAMEDEDEGITLPDDGSAITFRREDRRSHSYLYVLITLMVMLVMSVFSGDPSKTYLSVFPGWFVIVYFVMDAIEMETAKLRIDLRRIQIVRWKNALTIPMVRITDLDIWPKHSRQKTGLDIYYTAGGREVRQRIRIQDFRNFETIVALIKQGVAKKADFQLNDKQRRANKIFRSKNFDKLIIGVMGALLLGALHIQLLFGFAEFFRSIF